MALDALAGDGSIRTCSVKGSKTYEQGPLYAQNRDVSKVVEAEDA